MRNIIFAAICTGCLTTGLKAEPDPFVHFMAGVEVLRAARGMSDVQKAAWFIELEKITGISAAEAQVRIESYSQRPKQWKKIQDQIFELLDETKEPDKE